MLTQYFTNSTAGTVTGGQIGCEIETDFVDAATGYPIEETASRAIIATTDGRPSDCQHKLELGRQKFELAIAPCHTFGHLLERAQESLAWLYQTAARYGALPRMAPEISWEGNLLDESSDPRDEVWLKLDGRRALEELCRCSSVQFTVDVNPRDAVAVLSALWAAKLHELDYAPNHQRWLRYIKYSAAGYAADRYAGPDGFDSLDDYTARLAEHHVVMHRGQPVKLAPAVVPDLDVDLFLRSVWWHYRLRRYGDTLAVEIRPFARRSDDCIERYWGHIASVLGL